jgi:hypothetical protein
MQASHIADRINWGLNRTAKILGRETDAFRANGTSQPLDRTNRYLRLRAAFSRSDGTFGQPVGYGIATWRGYFDASYTRVGDYLVQEQDVWFIAAQDSLLPVLCVKTNAVLSVVRQIAPSTGTSTPRSEGTTADIISAWPASVIGIGSQGRPPTQLPGDTTIPNMTVLLPATHQQQLQPSDTIIDQYGSTSVIVSAELSDLGWRLNVRDITT